MNPVYRRGLDECRAALESHPKPVSRLPEPPEEPVTQLPSFDDVYAPALRATEKETDPQ